MKLKFFYIGISIGLLGAASPLLFSVSKKYLATPANQPKAEPLFIMPVGSPDARLALPIAADIFLAAETAFVKPTRNWNIPGIVIPAKTALAYETSQNNILFEKNGINEPRPIASMTKLMTALIVMENARLDDIFSVSKEAVETIGEMGDLVVGEKLSVESLLKIMLIRSSNDAAMALAENISGGRAERDLSQAELGGDTQIFVDLMNKKARDLKLSNTNFADPSGLSPENKSSAWDLVLIMREVLKDLKLREIMQTSSADVVSLEGNIHYIINTNKLLSEIPDILGGKTGYTEEAGNCMILAVKSPYNGGAIISVVMEARDRLAEMKSLIQWTKEAFLW